MTYYAEGLEGDTVHFAADLFVVSAHSVNSVVSESYII